MSDRWSTYDSNVQAYRSNMIASQSFLLAVATLSMDKTILGCVCVIIAIFQLWFIWFRVIRTRTIISYFHKFDLNTRFNNCGVTIFDNDQSCKKPLEEDTYVKDKTIRKKVNKELGKENPKLKHNMRLTRIKLDLVLPITFTILWIVIFLYIIKVLN